MQLEAIIQPVPARTALAIELRHWGFRSRYRWLVRGVAKRLVQWQ